MNQNQAVLTAVQVGATYQWVDCSNNFSQYRVQPIKLSQPQPMAAMQLSSQQTDVLTPHHVTRLLQ
ncbi:MAG: hypothetical protein IPJ93_05705 [Bacteroidota bacterium]|nr:MAG: hypothetical protein IPJ93_05705 [Bacteroidota bacterium]